jgi:peptidoglycan hydrolase-like protein with peptidoglycan-binding domain
MKDKRKVITAVVVAGSLGFGAQTILAQGTGSRPLENPTSQGQYEEKGTQQKRSSDTSEQRGTSGVSGSEQGTSGASQRGTQSGVKGGTESGSRPLERGVSEGQYEEKSANKPGKASNISEADMQQIKTALKAKGHNPGPMNGEFDSQTQKAIREFQQKNNLRVTGEVDEQTAAKLGVTIGGKSGSSRSSTGTGSSSSKSGSMGSESGSGAGSGSKSR